MTRCATKRAMVRQFEYSWLRALSKDYADFWQVTEDALVFAAKRLNVTMSAKKRELLMSAYLELKAWVDVPPVLNMLKKAGLKLALLSNFTPAMLRAAVNNSRLEGLFEHMLSTDAVRTYKPDPRAYQLATDAFRLTPQQIAFVAFGGWDAAGARTFGFPTFWANRMNFPPEELGRAAQSTSSAIEGLTDFVGLPRRTSWP